MSAEIMTTEAIERAARAIHEHDDAFFSESWDSLKPREQKFYMEMARSVLRAAFPAINASVPQDHRERALAWLSWADRAASGHPDAPMASSDDDVRTIIDKKLKQSLRYAEGWYAVIGKNGQLLEISRSLEDAHELVRALRSGARAVHVALTDEEAK